MVPELQRSSDQPRIRQRHGKGVPMTREEDLPHWWHVCYVEIDELDGRTFGGAAVVRSFDNPEVLVGKKVEIPTADHGSLTGLYLRSFSHDPTDEEIDDVSEGRDPLARQAFENAGILDRICKLGETKYDTYEDALAATRDRR